MPVHHLNRPGMGRAPPMGLRPEEKQKQLLTDSSSGGSQPNPTTPAYPAKHGSVDRQPSGGDGDSPAALQAPPINGSRGSTGK